MIDLSNVSLRDLAGFISEHLRKKGIDAVLVGGACVTIYSENRYQSYDLDYVEIVAKLRFSRISGSFEPIFDPFRVGNINMRI